MKRINISIRKSSKFLLFLKMLHNKCLDTVKIVCFKNSVFDGSMEFPTKTGLKGISSPNIEPRTESEMTEMS